MQMQLISMPFEVPLGKGAFLGHFNAYFLLFYAPAGQVLLQCIFLSKAPHAAMAPEATAVA
jgi:hypothetical protein